MLQEADSLQMKLQSQEDDFRIQNQTLMQELTSVSLLIQLLVKYKATVFMNTVFVTKLTVLEIT